MNSEYMKPTKVGSGQRIVSSDEESRLCYSLITTHYSLSSEVFDFAQESGDHVINEATHHNFLGNPRMGAELLQLMADVFVEILKGVEECRSDSGGPGAVLDASAQLLLGGMHQAAIRVIDDHELFRAQQIVGNHE